MNTRTDYAPRQTLLQLFDEATKLIGEHYKKAEHFSGDGTARSALHIERAEALTKDLRGIFVGLINERGKD